MTCPICRDRIETAWGGAVCYGCRLDRLVPSNYPPKEDYGLDIVWGHLNARAHPPTGVPILDSTPPRLSQMPALLKLSINMLRHR